ncbi:ABC transporter permease [Sphingobacterium sp. BIGb0165]|uniref:ABC transporter permease n=1 Tax=Sphingobacterium sp. BIGb0165 TaxID=2940615 RepID=UPI0021680AFC|nr:ABC transporter permease [Sphingobacterium sp. BIGb0165]MCS4225619.1 ABC-2 type transport system permease protein [Sphingobacterium sp. BIGb0165]
MHKILLIIQREYLSRVKKRSFIVMTFAVPLFFFALYAGMFYLTKKSFKDAHTEVFIIDQQGDFANKLQSNKNVSYKKSQLPLQQQKQRLAQEQTKQAILYIPQDILTTQKAELITSGKTSFVTQEIISGQLEDIIREKEYKAKGIDLKLIQSIKPKVDIEAKEITADGEEKNSNTAIAMGIGVALAILVYLSLFLYGAQVMRGIIEEKSNRIIEVIISSVKPFQLMMGKIVGIGMVGLTQFVMWLVLTLGLFLVATTLFINPQDIQEVAAGQPGAANMGTVSKAMGQGGSASILASIQSFNFTEVIVFFFLFFIAGYLLYSAIFAAAGSAVDNETEANQFSMPITMPLLLTYILSFGVIINDPNGPIATWLSFIPFTSPIAMLVRIPFGVPLWQILTSLTLLILTFLLITWVAARIYRVGILIYGKKASFKEIIKWFNYKN